jgi:peptidoglycan-associated lipoprotein
VIGHADPRGDAEYNYLLGQRRADGVRSAVVSAGLAVERISTTSRGEIEAQGGDEAGWALDRRVDVVLGDS